MEKQNMVYTYSRIRLSLKKEWNPKYRWNSQNSEEKKHTNNKKQKNEQTDLKMGRRPGQTIFWMKTYKWPTDTWKGAQGHSPSGKCKSKPRGAITSHLLEWLVRDACWRGYEEERTLVHCWWGCKLVQPLRKTVQKFLKILNIQLPYDPTVPLPGIYPKEMRSHVHYSAMPSSWDVETTWVSIKG